MVAGALVVVVVMVAMVMVAMVMLAIVMVVVVLTPAMVAMVMCSKCFQRYYFTRTWLLGSELVAREGKNCQLASFAAVL